MAVGNASRYKTGPCRGSNVTANQGAEVIYKVTQRQIPSRTLSNNRNP